MGLTASHIYYIDFLYIPLVVINCLGVKLFWFKTFDSSLQ